jgi:predicted dehydrogenase
MIKSARIGFLGAGGIAQAHAYALESLKYYYPVTPHFEKVVIASPTPESRNSFATRFGFQETMPPEEVWTRNDIDTLFILGPNQTHTPQLLKAVQAPTIQRIYVEKPIGISDQDILDLESLLGSKHGKIILVGFQYLQKSALRKALAHWRSGVFGQPIHFRAEYLHSSYLDPAYRQKHAARLEPIPINGAAADLGSHILSLLIAFLGEDLKIIGAAASGQFRDVPPNSDLCTTVLIEQPSSGAVGTMLASRVSHGTGDQLSLEIKGTQGAIVFETSQPDVYKSFLPEYGWQKHEVLSNYLPSSKFPAEYAPSGWLRALIHQHYLFFGGDQSSSYIPNLQHAIQVQRLLQQIAEFVKSSPSY